jgi:predicted dehydrogenase
MVENRRQFLGKAGAALVFKLVDSGFALRAAGPNDQVGFGFIGTGIRGSEIMGEFLKIPGVRPVIVADLYDGYLERAKEQTEGKIETTKDYFEVLNRKDVEAVVIATPDHWHKQMVLDSLDAGKHVYIEKPMTWSIPEGKAIISAAEKSGLVLQVGSQGKTSALTAKAREIVSSGALGKVTMVRMSNHRNNPEGAWVYPVPPDASPQTIDWDRFIGPAPKRPFDPKVFFRWRCWWDYSGGVATDLFVHLLTWLHEVMDVSGPKSVVSQGGLYRWLDGRNVPDVMNSLYEYEEGFLADMYVHLANSYPLQSTLIMGTEGTLVVGHTKLILHPETVRPDVQIYGSKAMPKAMRTEYFASKGYTAEGRPKEPLPPPKKPEEITVEGGPSHYEYFVMSIHDGSPSRENATEGHYAAGAGHLANLAYRRGRRMQWDLRTGKVRAG